MKTIIKRLGSRSGPTFCRSWSLSKLFAKVTMYQPRQMSPLSRKDLTHINLMSFLWDIGKQCRPRSETSQTRRLISLNSLLIECSITIWMKMKNTYQQPSKQKWTGPIGWNGKFHSVNNAIIKSRSWAVVLLLLTFCLLLLPLWESVIALCFVVRYFMSILVLLSSWGEERAGCFA